MEKTKWILCPIFGNYPMEWVQRLNNIRACAMEIVGKEIIDDDAIHKYYLLRWNVV